MDEKQEQKKLMLRRAEAAVMAHDFELAARLYKSFLKEDEENIDLLRALGSVYVKAGNDENALAYYEKINNLAPTDFNALNSLGGIYRRLKQYEKSIAVLKDALSLGEDDAQANYNLGFTYRALERYDEAIECFNSVIDVNPNDVLTYNHLGAIYAMRGEYQKAIASYMRGLQVDPNHPVLQLNLAKSYKALHNDADAAMAYEAALRAKPGWREATKDYINLLLRYRRTKDAEHLAKKSVALHPEDVAIRNALGKIYLKQFDYENAAQTFERAHKLNEKNIDALIGLAESYEKNNKINDALDAIRTVESLQDNDDAIKKQYAHVLLSAGKYEAAAKKITHVYNKDKNDVETLDLCGQYYICKDDENKADAYYKKIRTLDPSYAEYEKEASARYRQIGRLDKARTYVKRYLAKHKDDSDALILLAQLDEAENDITAALNEYRTVLKYDKDNVLASREAARFSELTELINRNHVDDEEESFERANDIEIVMESPEDAPVEEEVVQPSPILDEDDAFDFDAMGESLLSADDEVDPFEVDKQEDEEDESEPDGLDMLIPERPIDKDGKDVQHGNTDDDIFNSKAGPSSNIDEAISGSADDSFEEDDAGIIPQAGNAPVYQNQLSPPSTELLSQSTDIPPRPLEMTPDADAFDRGLSSQPLEMAPDADAFGRGLSSQPLEMAPDADAFDRGLSPALGADRIAAALDKANAASDYALSEARRAYDAAHEAVEKAERTARETVEKAEQAARETMENAERVVRESAQKAGEEAKLAAEEAKQSIEQAKEEARQLIEQAKEDVAQVGVVARDAADEAMESINQAQENARDAIQHMKEDAAQSISEMKTDVADAINELKDTAEKASGQQQVVVKKTKGLLALAAQIRQMLNLDRTVN